MKNYSFIFMLFICSFSSAQNSNDDSKLVVADTLINCKLLYQRLQWWISPEKEDLVWALWCDEERFKDVLNSYRNEKVVVYGSIYSQNDGRKMFSIYYDSLNISIGVLAYKEKLSNGLIRILECDSYGRNKEFFLENKLIYEIDVASLDVIKTLKSGSNDILIINEDDHGSCCPGGFNRILSIGKNKSVYVSDLFGSGEGKLKISKKGDKIIIEQPKYWDTPSRIWEFIDNTLTQIK